MELKLDRQSLMAPMPWHGEQALEIVRRLSNLGDRATYGDAFCGATTCALCHEEVGGERDDPSQHKPDCLYIIARRLMHLISACA